MGLLLFVLLIGLIPAAIAQSKGRSFIGWYVYGVLLFIVALVHSLVLRPDNKALEVRQIAAGGRKCPHCAEVIKREALVCRYCSRDVEPERGNPMEHLPSYHAPAGSSPRATRPPLVLQ